MTISREEVLHIAKLARLNLSETEINTYCGQLSEILNYVQKLRELNVENVEPMKHVLNMVNVMRDDKELPSLSREEVLSNTPEHDGEYFKVPKVLKGE